MLSYGKIARVLLIASAPVLAQTSPTTPVIQQPRTVPGVISRPAINPAAGPVRQLPPTTGTATASPTQPAPAPQTVVNSLPMQGQPSLPASLMVTPTTSIAHNGTTAVNYAQGKLSILAENAPLGSVLKLVASKTGAVVDLAPELQSEPVIASLGPAPVQDVLTRLLDSPKIDYIILGTGDEPGSLQRVVVRRRKSFGQMAMAPQPKPAEELDENGHLASNGLAPEDANLSQAELMDKWRQEREKRRIAEIEQQKVEREALKAETEATIQNQNQNQNNDAPPAAQENPSQQPPQNPQQ